MVLSKFAGSVEGELHWQRGKRNGIHSIVQGRPSRVSNQIRNVPFLTKIEMSPFLLLVCCLSIVGLARSEALWSPKGGTFRAKQRARPTMPASRRPPPLTPVFVARSGSLLARDDSQAVSTSVAPAAP